MVLPTVIAIVLLFFIIIKFISLELEKKNVGVYFVLFMTVLIIYLLFIFTYMQGYRISFSGTIDYEVTKFSLTILATILTPSLTAIGILHVTHTYKIKREDDLRADYMRKFDFYLDNFANKITQDFETIKVMKIYESGLIQFQRKHFNVFDFVKSYNEIKENIPFEIIEVDKEAHTKMTINSINEFNDFCKQNSNGYKNIMKVINIFDDLLKHLCLFDEQIDYFHLLRRISPFLNEDLIHFLKSNVETRIQDLYYDCLLSYADSYGN